MTGKRRQEFVPRGHLAGVAAALALAARASACPFCDGGPAGVNEVRATLFGDAFWPNLLATAAPFGVFLAAAAWIHFGTPGPKRPRNGEGRP